MARVSDVLPDTGSTIDLDPAVLEVLPHNSKVIKSYTYGTATWTRAARIIVSLEAGIEQSFFLKCSSEELGRTMIQAEFASLSEIYRWSPALTPIPYATGRFRDSSIPTYFLLMEFLEMQTGPPEPANFMKQLADLHSRSKSPTGQFGFHMITCVGPNAQDTTWESSWTVFYTKLLRQFYDRELRVCGPTKDGEYEAGMETLIARTVPALLDPLQANGRTLEPSLVHGDLWEENTGTEFEGGQPKIFDPAVFYAHNEYDFAAWRSENVPFGRPYYRQYFKHMPPSEPKEQWDDRNKLYAIRAEIHHSSLWPALCESQREIVLGYIRDLNAKYATDDTVGGAVRDASLNILDHPVPLPAGLRAV